MKDHSAGGISDSDAAILIRDLARAVQVPGVEFFTGVSYRNLMAVRDGDFSQVKTVPPHEIPNEPIEPHLPSGRNSELLRSIMTQSARMFDAFHEVTRRRVGVNPATQAWLWGQGKAASLAPFAERFGVASGCMITGVDLLRGLAKLIGWDVHDVAGMTSFHDTDYARQGAESAAMLDRYDFVLSHVESPDEASHQADVKTKIAAIEAIDRDVVGPVLARLKAGGEWRVLVLPDHPTNVATRKHGYAPTPFAMAGTGLAPSGATLYSEAQAKAGPAFPKGHELMAAFLDVASEV
jgi:2,3-bisphosphoglycerate-independent phosphoglycerate mutase